MSLPNYSSFELLETTIKHRGEECWLMDYHVERLLSSATTMSIIYSDDKAFRNVPTPEEVKSKVQEATKQAEESSQSEYFRVRILLSYDGKIQVGVTPETPRVNTMPLKIVLDNEPVSSDNVFLRHKTTHRPMYNKPREKYNVSLTDVERPFDVVLYNEDGNITETTIANFAIQIPDENGNLVWTTPPLKCGLLGGTMRRYLLESGTIKEGVITKEDLLQAKKDNRKMCCFNSVRKMYEVELVDSV
ncbi:hypothetical protein H4219_004211 [Mycoemilia scoparia]|uniref:Uncharacterized protein n=1 Tax=Mycoemilia scoparia TaxID=417184 RepID=A0A9W8A0H7_9FUNG|nr:hypothetical protein H4219_004211 [Mycoemilia scoparia]